MFDIGFPELLIVSVVALLVLGPERLPEALRTLSLWIARMRRSFLNVKAEIEREIGADEIRREIYNEQVLEQSSRFKGEIQGIVDDLNQPIDKPPRDDVSTADEDVPEAGEDVPEAGEDVSTAGEAGDDAKGHEDAGAHDDAGAHQDASAEEDERTAQEPLSAGPSRDNDHADSR
jgi:sec-independent protein translocase protein TatB